jgi:hypothetical protein
LTRFGAFIGDTAVKHPNEFVIAVATVSLAIFTAVLAIATIRLWNSTAELARFAELQAGDTKESISVAKSAADAAAGQLELSRTALITTVIVVTNALPPASLPPSPPVTIDAPAREPARVDADPRGQPRWERG